MIKNFWRWIDDESRITEGQEDTDRRRKGGLEDGRWQINKNFAASIASRKKLSSQKSNNYCHIKFMMNIFMVSQYLWKMQSWPNYTSFYHKKIQRKIQTCCSENISILILCEEAKCGKIFSTKLKNSKLVKLSTKSFNHDLLFYCDNVKIVKMTVIKYFTTTLKILHLPPTWWRFLSHIPCKYISWNFKYQRWENHLSFPLLLVTSFKTFVIW